MKAKSKKIFNYLFIIVTVAVVATIGALDTNVKNIGDAIAGMQPAWLLGALGGMVGFWLLDALIFQYTTNCMHKKLSYGKSLTLSLIGQYYSAITPFGSGEPFQVVYMKREGIPIGYSSSILTVKFIGFQYGVVLLYIAGMILHAGKFYVTLNRVFWLSILGFAINLAVLLVAAFIMINAGWVTKIMLKLTKFFHKIKIIKNLDKANASMMNVLNDFRKSAVFVRENKLQMTNIVLLTVVHLICYFGISYCVYRAFGLSQHTFDEILTMQVLLFLTVSFFPTPGASGANETGFYLFFSPFFPKSVLFVAMMVWRFITYYLNIMVGAATVFFDSLYVLAKNRRLAKRQAGQAVAEPSLEAEPGAPEQAGPAHEADAAPDAPEEQAELEAQEVEAELVATEQQAASEEQQAEPSYEADADAGPSLEAGPGAPQQAEPSYEAAAELDAPQEQAESSYEADTEPEAQEIEAGRRR